MTLLLQDNKLKSAFAMSSSLRSTLLQHLQAPVEVHIFLCIFHKFLNELSFHSDIPMQGEAAACYILYHDTFTLIYHSEYFLAQSLITTLWLYLGKYMHPLLLAQFLKHYVTDLALL